MKKRAFKKKLSITLTLVMLLSTLSVFASDLADECLPVDGYSADAEYLSTEDDTDAAIFSESEPRAGAQQLRQMEYLSRGLVAAYRGTYGGGGVFISWRFLGDEPDGISWNVYRSNDVGDTWTLITTIKPRDVAPETNFETNPGIVKENVTPSNFVDYDGLNTSIYEVAPVIDGVEGVRQGMSIPMLSLQGSTETTITGSRFEIPVAYLRPATLPRPQFNFRGVAAGTANIPQNANTQVRDAEGNLVSTTYGFLAAQPNANQARHFYYTVDMNLFREFREAYRQQTAVTQAMLNDWVARLNEHNMTPNHLGNRNLTAPWTPTNPLVDGRITTALFDELEEQFYNYVVNLDVGDRLPLMMTPEGAIATVPGAAYNIHEISVGDFTGNGEYDIVFKWQANSTDNMLSCPIAFGNVVTPPVIIDVVDIWGNHLFRVDLGYNVKATNDHETVMFVQDFDGSGRASLMLKTAAGSRIGQWCDEAGDVVYRNCLDTVVGGEYGLGATTDRMLEYIATGNYEAMNHYWNVINGWSISYRDPRIYGGNDGQSGFQIPRDPTSATHMTWVKTYHIGQMGEGPWCEETQTFLNYEYFTAFQFCIDRGEGFIVDSTPYPFINTERNWGLAPMSQRGNYTYQIDRTPTINTPRFAESERYWLMPGNQWGYWSLGDPQGNRSNRYIGATASLDGVNWFAISQRGYYERTTISAFRIIDGRVVNTANFDSANPIHHILKNPQCAANPNIDIYVNGVVVATNRGCVVRPGHPSHNPCDYFCGKYFYQNRGNHTAHVGTLPNGRDFYSTGAASFVLGTCYWTGEDVIHALAIYGDIFPSFDDHRTAPEYPTNLSWTEAKADERYSDNLQWWPERHGDRSALLPVDKTNTLVHWSCREENIIDDVRFGTVHGYFPLSTAYNPITGAMVQGHFGNTTTVADWDAGIAGNFFADIPGAVGTLNNAQGNRAYNLSTGELLLDRVMGNGGGAIWWVGNLTHQWQNSVNIFTPSLTAVNGGTAFTHNARATVGTNKGVVPLKADFWGDWREELLTSTTANNLVIFTSTIPSQYGIRTLMHDPMYRAGVATQNNGYSQLQFAGFYLGDEAPLPPKRRDIIIGVPEQKQLTFILYTDNPTILNAFADYTTIVDGRAKIVIPVLPEEATDTWPGLEYISRIGHLFGTEQAHGYAFWGWFDDEALDASGRRRAGLRRPALTVPPEEDTCILTALLAQIDAGTASFESGNINLYGVWVRWGDVDDNGAVNMTDLNLLQRHVNFGHLMPVALSAAAGDVVVDGGLSMMDLNLLQRHVNLAHIMNVVLGAEPQPAAQP